MDSAQDDVMDSSLPEVPITPPEVPITPPEVPVDAAPVAQSEMDVISSTIGKEEIETFLKEVFRRDKWLRFVSTLTLGEGLNDKLRTAFQGEDEYRDGAILFTHMFSKANLDEQECALFISCLLYTSPSPRDRSLSRMPSSA